MSENRAVLANEYSWAIAGADDDLRAHVRALLWNVAGIDTINPAKLPLGDFTAIVIRVATDGQAITVEDIASETYLFEVQRMCLMFLKGLARVVCDLYIERKEDT
ncbi:hypothetical protein [Ferrimicrobium sp.]|uniref:hypothetical protein n=1 Tax=Ferrimicrobium sp. TaxID=2926050 RepID=UPI00261B38F0|nr:hypothetical protein [Ferrimicrobium sp.]